MPRSLLLSLSISFTLALSTLSPAFAQVSPHANRPFDGKQTYFGPGDPRNYSSYWLHVYEGELATLIGGGRLVAGWFGAPLGTSAFFQQNLNHWWQGSGSPIDVPSTDAVAQELHDDPEVQSYYSDLSDSGWALAVQTWIAGQAAVIPCGTTGTTEVNGIISYQQTREGIGLVFKQFNGIYGVGKPWMTSVQTDAIIKRAADGSLSYTATGDAKIFKAWGWPTDPYSTWSDWDLNFKSWYVEYYGGAKAFPLTVDLGNFSWSGKVTAKHAGECAPLAPKTPTYDAPIDLTGPNGQTIDSTGHVSISQNGQYVAVEGGLSGYTQLDTGGGYAYGGASNYTGFTYSGWNGVNNSGEVAGWNGSCTTPEVYENGQDVVLTAASGPTPDECGVGNISNNGNLVGDGDDDASYNATSWLYNAKTKTYVNLKPLSPGSALMIATNDSGTVVGESSFLYGDQQTNWADTMWPNGSGTPKKIGPAPLKSGWVPDAEDINNNNLSVGEGFYPDGGATDDGDAYESANGAGFVALGALAKIAPSGCSNGFCSCGESGSDYSESDALSVNSEGDVVGGSIIAPPSNNPDGLCGQDRAVIWPKGATTPTDLNAAIPKKTGWVLTEATGISDTGDVVGLGTDNGTEAAFLLAGPQKLSGTVSFADGASPATTHVVITDSSDKIVATETPDGAGFWSITLPAQTYTVKLENLPKDYSAENGTVERADNIGGPEVIDFAVSPDPPACQDIDAAHPDGCGPNGFYEPTRETRGVDVSTAKLPVAVAGKSYASKLSDMGGLQPVTWSLAAGSSLPAGLTLSDSGELSGSPKSAAAGVDSFTVQATDSSDPVETGYATLSDVVLPEGSSSAEVTGISAETTRDGQATTVAGGPGSPTPNDTVSGAGDSGTITVVGYGSNPESAKPSLKSPSYLTVALGPDSTFSAVKVSVCGTAKGSGMEWFDPSTKAWAAVSPAAVSTTSNGKPCAAFSATSKSTPTVTQLAAAGFAVGKRP